MFIQKKDELNDPQNINIDPEKGITSLKNNISSFDHFDFKKELPSALEKPIQPEKPSAKIELNNKTDAMSGKIEFFPKKEEPNLKIEAQNETLSLPAGHSNGKKILIVIIVLLIFIAIGLGGYYFWATRINIDAPPEAKINTDIDVPKIAGETKETQKIPPVLSPTSPNYLIIPAITDLEYPASLEKEMQKVSATEAGTLIEFILTEKNNTPIPFENFVQSFGLKLSPATLIQLNSDFSLYAYNYGEEKVRLGISIGAKDGNALKTALLENEKGLIQELAPLMQGLAFQNPTDNTFKAGNYKGIEVRYLNITSPDDVSIDYAVHQDKLIIGITKTVAFSIIDRE